MAPKKKYVLVRNEEAAAPPSPPKSRKAKKYILTSNNEAAAEEALRAIEPRKVKKSAAAVPTPIAVAETKSRKKKYVLKRDPTNAELVAAIPITLGEEVQAALVEWYRARGEPLPAEYVDFGAKVDAEERERDKALMDALYPPEPAPGAPAVPKPLGPKPEFGTPEFWKWARESRKQKDAERAAAGLPPLPTAAEKRAKAAAKADAKAKAGK